MDASRSGRDSADSARLVQPTRLELALLDPQVALELGMSFMVSTRASPDSPSPLPHPPDSVCPR